MKRGSTIFLRAAVAIIGLIVVALCVFAIPPAMRDPKTGNFFPVLVGLYVTAVPFFIALYQTLKLLNYIDRNQAFSDVSVKALKYIKYCAVTISILFALSIPYIHFVADTENDGPGVLVPVLIIIFASGVIGTAAGVLQKLVQNAVDIKSENDLTV